MLKLKGAVQHYDWGKRGRESEVAKLVLSAHPEHEIEDVPYAELWMGTHPSGPSVIVEPKDGAGSLAEWIAKRPQSLGAKNVERFGVQLPFLLKVLSVNKALSIQAHPDKKHAEQLHAERPDVYKDHNHKPEMAIALTSFEALCGFRVIDEILFFMKEIHELVNVVGEDNIALLRESAESDIKANLKRCFRSLMTCSDAVRERNLTQLAEKFSKQNDDRLLSKLFLRIHSAFPGDVGCFGIYFFNYLHLAPGEAIFLGPNEPHAYLYGDCVECMACSDNVVRAGLTPKYKDVETLCDMLTYNCASARENVFHGSRIDEHAVLFSPPIPDFALVKMQLPRDVKEYRLKASSSASIVLLVQGSAEALVKASTTSDGPIDGLRLSKGNAIFVEAGTDVVFRPHGNDDLLAFQALSNL